MEGFGAGSVEAGIEAAIAAGEAADGEAADGEAATGEAAVGEVAAGAASLRGGCSMRCVHLQECPL